MSSFPSATAGYGLLMLRGALSIAGTVIGVERLAFAIRTPPDAPVIAFGISGAVWTIGSVFVALGFLTRRVVPIVSVVEAAVTLMRLGADLTGSALPGATNHLLEAAIAAGLALTGPGAYSVDARIYGRREIVIRPRTTTHFERLDRSAQ